MVDEEPAGDLLATPQAGPAAIRGGVLRVSGYVIGGLMSAVSAAFLLRHLGRTVFGFYITAQSLIAIVDGVSDLGLTAMGVKELSLRERASRAVFARNLLGLRIAVTVVGIFVMIGFGAIVGYRTIIVEGVAIAGVGLLLQCAQASLAISLMSRLRLGWVTAIELMRQLILMTLIIGLVIAGAGMLPFLATTIPATGAALLLTAWLVHGDVPITPAFDAKEWRSMLAVILPYSAAVAASAIYFRMAVIVVSLTASAAALGDFGAAFRVTEAIIVIPGLVAAVAFPIFARAARDDRDRLGYAVRRVFQVNLLLAIWAALGIAIGAPLAIRILAGPSYAGAVPILAIQGVAVGASFLTALWSQALLSLGRLRMILVYNVVLLAGGTAAVLVGVQADGTEGAAMATSLVEVLGAIAGAIILIREDHHLHLPLGVLPRAALAAALAALPALLPAGTLVKLIAMTAVFAGAILALGLLPDELRDELRRVRTVVAARLR